MPPRVHVITIVGGAGVAILPRTLAHYQAMGVESFFVTIHLQALDKISVARVREMAASCGIAIESVMIEPDPSRAARLTWERIMRARPDDWFLPIDADEFQVYPAGLLPTLADCDARGYTYVNGGLVDRVSRDGTLAPLKLSEPVWSQYPLGGYITQPLLGGDPRKVVAVKGRVPLGVGHHIAFSDQGCPIERHAVPVHHFKWVGTLIPYLEKRLRDYKRLDKPWWIESERGLRYFERQRGIDISDPEFLIAPCDPHYAAWDRVVERLQRYGQPQDASEPVAPPEPVEPREPREQREPRDASVLRAGYHGAS
jgi:hypothetical protein